MIVVTKASGGLPVVDVTATKPLLGMPVRESAAGLGVAITAVTNGFGMPIAYVPGFAPVPPGPTFVNAATQSSGSGASISPALPTGRVNGNLLICWHKSTIAGQANTLSVDAGWNVLASIDQGAAYAYRAYWRYVTGTEASPVCSQTAAITCVAQVLQYSGVHPTSPIGASLASKAAAQPANNAGITSTAANSRALNLLYTVGGSSIGSPTASGFTVRNTVGVVSQCSDKLLGASGSSSGSFSCTMSGSVTNWSDIMAELKGP